MIVYITGIGPQWIDSAVDGKTVSYSVPAGSVLRRQEGEDFVTETRPSPFVHAGPRTSYRIDCDTYTAPVTAVLTID